MNKTLETLWKMCDYLCGGENCPEGYEAEKRYQTSALNMNRMKSVEQYVCYTDCF